jgi:SAM-dependent methyltransferase
MASHTKCRHCAAPLSLVFADLGATPVANDYLSEAQAHGGESFYPLRAFVCRSCRLVQLEDFRRADELFREDYAYFSSISSSWVAHARGYAEDMTARYRLDAGSQVVEVASNDGYLLQFFREKGVKILGVEPSRSVAEFAVREKNIPTRVEFFGRELGARLAREGFAADLTAANNVLAHVPDINDFMAGFREILKPEGVSTFEFPHLLSQIRENQFDTIYHEHFSYLSLLAVSRVATTAGMRVFDVEKLPTHGGSLRLHVCRAEAAHTPIARLAAVMAEELEAGLDGDDIYAGFAAQAVKVKFALLELLIGLKREGRSIVGYGAPAKGNTLLNYCGVGADFLDFTVDKAPSKQGRYLPGTRLPILGPEAIKSARPDYVLILPWNIKDEIIREIAYVREWGAKFIVPIPMPAIVA